MEQMDSITEHFGIKRSTFVQSTLMRKSGDSFVFEIDSFVLKIYQAFSENMRNPASIHSRATIGGRWNAIQMAFSWWPIVARFYVLTGKWAGIWLNHPQSARR